MDHSPPERSSTLPPMQRRESFQRRERVNRPRKSSITQNSRKPKHEKAKSKDFGRRLSIEGRKAFSAEPPTLVAAAAKKQRWDELVEAAASATEADSDRDITPVSKIPGRIILKTYTDNAGQMPQSPSSVKRASLPPLHPPFTNNQSFANNQSYKSSPLTRTLTPPQNHSLSGPPPFATIVETGLSLDQNRGMHSAHTSSASGRNFHIPSSGLSSSDTTSPIYYDSQRVTSDSQSSNNGSTQVQIFCANCRRLSVLKDSYACTECISGFCTDCLYYLSSDPRSVELQRGGAGMVRGRPCPRCGMMGGRYKPFQLDIR
ncbi:uncharacterized protein KY384_002605 [Bacidia gigantensis]|uniref:uncharacterized protein n=1 Tax=Bacidia gigantensis TaxID=2732470 RepID=UPI001D04B9EE|nr:uncharacterized protein KY384_002605 [Bacidia gigantensis]KAG8532728.1 hypothetical protein KY384_002605 [Bacidia gigantensis]